MATKYDNWKTSAPDTNSEAWTEAVEEVADDIGPVERAEIIQTIAAADDALAWVCHAIQVPQHHLSAFRDLVKMAADYRKQVERQMAEYPDARR